MRKRRYYQLGSDYIALSPNGMTVFMCCSDPWNIYAKQQSSESMYNEIETNQVKVEITAEEFQKQFSAAVDYLHNDTPFA